MSVMLSSCPEEGGVMSVMSSGEAQGGREEEVRVNVVNPGMESRREG